MKYEELFKAWKSEQYKDQSTEEKMEFVEHLHTFPKYFEKTFLAGLKAGRPQWHDLRKDPTDLPKDTVSVLISRGLPRTDRARYNGKWYGYYSDDEIEDVIAWCEIPTFDKE